MCQAQGAAAPAAEDAAEDGAVKTGGDTTGPSRSHSHGITFRAGGGGGGGDDTDSARAPHPTWCVLCFLLEICYC